MGRSFRKWRKWLIVASCGLLILCAVLVIRSEVGERAFVAEYHRIDSQISVEDASLTLREYRNPLANTIGEIVHDEMYDRSLYGQPERFRYGDYAVILRSDENGRLVGKTLIRHKRSYYTRFFESLPSIPSSVRE